MDRNAFLLYLRNIRDLELARHKVTALRATANTNYAFKKRKLDYLEVTEDYSVTAKKEGNMYLAYVILFCVVGIPLLIWKVVANKGWFDSLVGIVTLTCGIMAIGCLIPALAKYLQATRTQKHIQEENRKAQQKYNSLREESRKNDEYWQKKIAFYDREIKKVNSLLRSSYAMNLIPNQYRNLQSMYYIYDYMSSSRATFEETLMHEHMENGIQRILEKLDTIIAQNEQIIYQNRTLEAQNQERINQNNAMLQSLGNIEKDVEMAAQYSKLAADYNQVNAFFSAANYLRNAK